MESALIWFLHLSAHIFSWLMIYVGTICLDVNELLGIKQVCENLSVFKRVNVTFLRFLDILQFTEFA